MSGKTFMAFVIGLSVGAIGSWCYFKNYYFGPVEEPEDDDNPKNDDISETDKMDEDHDEAPVSEKTEYHKAVERYTKEPEEKGPYVISREEFNDGTMPCHVTYSYFEDGILTDEYNVIVEDADEALGEEFVNHFDEDLVYIRNEKRKCDYEILREGFTYHEPPEYEEEDKED